MWVKLCGFLSQILGEALQLHSHKRAPSSYWKTGGGGGVSPWTTRWTSLLALNSRGAQQQGCQKMKRGKKPEADIFSGVSAAGNPALRARGFEQTDHWGLFCRQNQHTDPSATTLKGPRRAPRLNPIWQQVSVLPVLSLAFFHSVLKAAQSLPVVIGEIIYLD